MIAGHNIRLDAVLDICFSPHYVQWQSSRMRGLATQRCLISTSTLIEACQDLARPRGKPRPVSILCYGTVLFMVVAVFCFDQRNNTCWWVQHCKLHPCKESRADSGAVARMHQQLLWTGALGHACICNICSKLKDFINDNAVIYDMCIKTKDTIDDSAVCYDTNSTHGIAEMKYNVRTTRCLLTSLWVPMH